MKNIIYVFPGTFSPPTYGHLEVVKRASELCENLTIICSRNPDKKTWFTPEECVELWKSYHLPDNVTVTTFSEFTKQGHDISKIVMIRGIRSEKDLAHENNVVLLNKKEYGINNYLYILTSLEFENISSSLAREFAEKLNFETLSNIVSPMVISALIEKVLGERNVVLVVGRPASGKSTFLEHLRELDKRNIHINTDEFNHKLKALLKERFGEEDILKIAETNEEELLRVTAKPWFDLLRETLRMAPKNANIFIEAAYGLQDNKRLFRFLGGKILCVGCRDESLHKERLTSRGTPNLLQFVSKIPGIDESAEIAIDNKLEMITVITDGSTEVLDNNTKKLNHKINEEVNSPWKTCLLE